MLSVLRRPSFALLWTGGLISVAGDWVLIAALPYFVYQVTGSTVATAAMIAAELGPSVLLASFAGVFVDRWDRKHVLIVGNVLQAAVVLLLLFVDASSLWIVFVVAAAQSTVAAFAGPAEAALLPTLVGPEDLVAANALNVFNNRLGRLAGVPLGGALLGALGLTAVVIVDAATFLIAAMLILFVRAPRRARPTEVESDAATRSAWRGFWRDWRDGLSIVRDERRIALLFVVFGLATFGGTMLDPLTVAWARDTLRVGPELYASLSAVHALFGILGTLFVARYRERLDARDLIGWASVAAGLALVVKYDVPLVPLALGLSAVGGVCSSVSAVGVETLAQREVPDAYRGRVFGSLNATLALLSLSGAAIGGALGEIVGVVPMLNVAAALVVLSGLVALRAYARAPSPISA